MISKLTRWACRFVAHCAGEILWYCPKCFRVWCDEHRPEKCVNCRTVSTVRIP